MRLLSLVLTFMISMHAFARDVFEPMAYLPVQDNGRVKPFDTLARESLGLVYGEQTYNGRPATEIVMTWMIVPEHWDETNFVKVTSEPLKKALKLDLKRRYFSPKELMNNNRMGVIFSELQSKRQGKEKLNPYDQAVAHLENQLGVYHQIKLGNYIRMVPPTQGDRWLALAELSPELNEKFRALAAGFVHHIQFSMHPTPAAADEVQSSADFSKAVDAFMNAAREQNPALYPPMRPLRVEVHYNRLAPFEKAGLFYFVTFLLLAVGFFVRRKALYYLALVSLSAAFLLHTYGFGLRIYLMGRPPVSNMYESVIWVSFVTVVFSIVFEAIFRNRFALLASSAVATLCLMVADFAPTILDPTLQPLEPVLRSNYWLIIHVMTITSGYAAFFLAFALGDMGLIYYLRGEKEHSKMIQTLAQLIYRVMQVGVVLLAAGTILGGVWADYSWGRFWGWDPKETWAFITLLGYIALLHGRIAGWVKNLGMIAGAVVAFSLVMMAWYGVNFVLGAGLHSYGFGAGGVQYVSAFVAIHWVFVAFTVWYVIGLRERHATAAR